MKWTHLIIFTLLSLLTFPSFASDADDWLKKGHKAAEQGDVILQKLLGKMYLSGKGVPEDHKQAAHWFTKATEQGSVEAQKRLDKMYGGG